MGRGSNDSPDLTAGALPLRSATGGEAQLRLARPDDELITYQGEPTALEAFDFEEEAIVAVIGEQVVGNLIYLPPTADERTVFVDHAWVDPAFRTRGIYRSMVALLAGRYPDAKPDWELGGNPLAHRVLAEAWQQFEATGDSQLDAVVAEFIYEEWEEGRPFFNPDHPEDQGNGWDWSLLRDPQEAFTRCVSASQQFVDAARARGLDAFMPWEPQAQSLGPANGQWYPEYQQRIDTSGHAVAYVETGDDILAVDWTASQFFGADAPFPLISRLVDGAWRRL